MLELSLQPNSLEQSSDSTTYTWEYKRLVQARPIAIDVLGIAALDRLGELTWLGPLSVLVFGILIALIARKCAHVPYCSKAQALWLYGLSHTGAVFPEAIIARLGVDEPWISQDLRAPAKIRACGLPGKQQL